FRRCDFDGVEAPGGAKVEVLDQRRRDDKLKPPGLKRRRLCAEIFQPHVADLKATGRGPAAEGDVINEEVSFQRELRLARFFRIRPVASTAPPARRTRQARPAADTSVAAGGVVAGRSAADIPSP